MDAGLRHVATRDYSLKCNWKVFADNYLVSTDPSCILSSGRPCIFDAGAASQSGAPCKVMQDQALNKYCRDVPLTHRQQHDSEMACSDEACACCRTVGIMCLLHIQIWLQP